MRVYKICDTILKRRSEKKFFESWLRWFGHDPAVTYGKKGELTQMSGAIYSITDIAQGNTDSTRIGDKVWMQSIHIKMSLAMNFTNDATTDTRPWKAGLRMIVIQWFDNDTYNTPTASKFLGATSGGSGVNNGTRLWNHDNAEQFWILHDKVYPIDEQNHCLTHVDMILKPVKKKIDFNSGGLSGTNKVYVWCHLWEYPNNGGRTVPGTDEGGYAENNIDFTLTHRVTYYDS